MIHRILHTADWHYGRTNHSIITSTGIHTKCFDTDQAVEQIFDIVKNESPEIFVFAGDWSQVNKPNPQYNRKIIDILHKLEDEISLLIWISGNHTSSASSNYNAVAPLKSAFKNISHFHFFYDNEINNLEYNGINFVCVPHTNSLRRKTHKDFEQVIGNTLKCLKEDKTNILISHFPLSNAIDMPDDTKFKSEALDYSTIQDIFHKFNLILLGDIHKAQKIGTNVFYSGSIIQNTFSEQKEKKGVYLFDVDTSDKSFQEQFIEIKSREYTTIELENFKDYEQYNCNDYIGKILRIKYPLDSIQDVNRTSTILQEYFNKTLFTLPEFSVSNMASKLATLSNSELLDAIKEYIENEYKDDIDKDYIFEQSINFFNKIKIKKESDY